MSRIISWFREQRKHKRFRIYMAAAVLLAAALCLEFYLFQYAALKVIRYMILLAALFIIAWIDLKSKRIPNQILLFLLAVRAVLLFLEWIFYADFGLSVLISSAAGALIGGGMFLLCYFLTRGGVGMGDVKLFAVLGFFVGVSAIFTVTFLTVMASAIYSVIMLVRKKTNLKEEMPFAPFVLIGTILTMALGM